MYICTTKVVKHYTYHLQFVLTLADCTPWWWYIFTSTC